MELIDEQPKLPLPPASVGGATPITEEEIEYQRKKDKLTMVRFIVLTKNNIEPFKKLSSLNPFRKKRILEEITQLFETQETELIQKEFNELMNDTIFYNSANFEILPVEKNGMTYPQMPQPSTPN